MIVKLKAKSIDRKVIIGFCIFYIIVSVAVQAWASAYTPIQADDWLKFEGARYHLGDCLKSGIKYTKAHYLSWRGCFTTTFFEGFSIPIRQHGHVAIQLLMVAIVVSFFALMVYSIGKVSSRLGCKHLYLVISSLMVYMLLNYYPYTEIYYWFAGAMSYLIPLYFFMPLVGSMVKQEICARECVGASILAFLSSGAPLNIVSMNGWVLIVLTWYFWKSNHQTDRRRIVILVAALCGAILNIASPGYYTRLSTVTDSLSLPQTVYYSLSYVVHEWIYLFRDCNVGLILVIAVMLGYLFGRGNKDNKKRKLIAIIALMFTPVISCFPVLYGYGVVWMPERCVFILHLQLYLLLIITGMFTGQLAKSKLQLKRNETPSVILVFCVCMLVYQLGNGNGLIQKQMVEDLALGKYQAYYEEYKKAFDMSDNYTELCQLLSDVEGPKNYHVVY